MLRDLAVALAGSDTEVLVAVDDAVAARWSVPPGVRATGWLPLNLALPSCDLVVLHGGPGSVFTAFALGVPQLALPQTADQYENAERLVAEGAGRQLLPAERDADAVVAAAHAVLTEPLYRKHSEVIAEENEARPSPAAVVSVLERLAR
jgi:glycosyltransferase